MKRLMSSTPPWMAAIRRPGDDGPDAQYYMTPPQPDERVLQTFCGT